MFVWNDFLKSSKMFNQRLCRFLVMLHRKSLFFEQGTAKVKNMVWLSQEENKM